MDTLLLRYAAPLMSFADQGRFANRHTAPSPTLSAVQGMVAAAAGIGRVARYPDWIADLDMAIRVERPGRPLRDYHTINPPAMRHYRHLSGERRAKVNPRNGKVNITYKGDLDRVRTVATVDGGRRADPVLSDRWYLSDADYLLAIADPTGDVSEALGRPRWTLYAGRKSCPLTEPFLLGVTTATPHEAVAVLPSPTQHGDSMESSDDTATYDREAIVLHHPSEGAVTRSEARNDRLVGFKRHVAQTRYHIRLTVPAIADWFGVIDHLRPRSAA